MSNQRDKKRTSMVNSFNFLSNFKLLRDTWTFLNLDLNFDSERPENVGIINANYQGDFQNTEKKDKLSIFLFL